MKEFLILGLVLLAGGCGSGDDDAAPAEEEVQLPAVDCAAETVPTYAQVTIFHTTCVTCHSSTKTGDARKGMGAEAAPISVNFDTYAAAKTSAIKAAEELYEDARGAMPPEDSQLAPATEAEKKQVLVWAKCGTPQ
jgi:hypothetical protein